MANRYPLLILHACRVISDIILSAAHCAEIESDTVYVGSSRTFGIGEAGGRGVQRSITQRMIHPMYQAETVDYDFLVMQLDSSVDMQPTLLNEDGSVPINGEELTVIGYGTTTEGGFQPSTLQEVVINYIPTETCNVNYSGKINGATMLCAGVGGGKDSCQGDSGGPLVVRNGDAFIQVGIVSWGYGCADPSYPGVYSRVSGEIDWIKDQICTLSSDPPDYCGELGGGTESGGGEVSVRLDIIYDDYPNEIGWSIKSGEEIIMDKPVGSLDTPGLVQERIKLRPGNYDFQIRDTFGDGICCRFQDGNYQIYAEMSDSELLLASSDGQFGSGETQPFSVPNPGATGTAPPASPPTLSTPPTGPSGEPNLPPLPAPVTTPVSFPPASPFGVSAEPFPIALTTDPASTTMTASPGPSESLVVSPTTLTSEPFSLPTSPVAAPFPVSAPTAISSPFFFRSTPSPVLTTAPNTGPIASPTSQTPYPTRPMPTITAPVDSSPPVTRNNCADTKDTFLVNDEIGQKDCVWLSENSPLFGYLCQFLDVAVACKETCEACQYFDPGWL